MDEVKSEKAAMDSDRMWLVHKGGYTAVRVLPIRSTSRSNPLAIHTIMVRTHGRDTKQVKLEGTEEIMEVAEEDLEKVCEGVGVWEVRWCRSVRVWVGWCEREGGGVGWCVRVWVVVSVSVRVWGLDGVSV